ncbi:cell envelope integrity protein TolA [Nitrosomonas sp. ANs5]|uniref:cell envelope integrity protein TolA n=1 Tax=Nitrosomonas sp. ANs5 TaxID=3423941 RepID=UPI003D34FEFC
MMRTTAWRGEDIIEPGKLRAALFSCLLHIVFLILLVFGFNWKSDVPEAMQVELWSDLPQPQPQPVKPEPLAPRPAPEPTKPSQAPQPVIAPAPPPAHKPAIAIKEKMEKPMPVKERPKQPDPVKKEVAKPEPVKEPEPKPEKEPPQKNEVMAREKQQKAEALAREKQREQEAMALKAEQSRIADEIAKYKAMIQAKIRSRIVMPPDLPGNPVVEFRVTLLPGGDVLSVSLRKSSGYAAFDEAVERAIFLAKPLPLPPDQRLFRAFRDFSLIVHYRE